MGKEKAKRRMMCFEQSRKKKQMKSLLEESPRRHRSSGKGNRKQRGYVIPNETNVQNRGGVRAWWFRGSEQIGWKKKENSKLEKEDKVRSQRKKVVSVKKELS